MGEEWASLAAPCAAREARCSLTRSLFSSQEKSQAEMSLGLELYCLGGRMMEVKQTVPPTLSSAFKLVFFPSPFTSMLEHLHWKPGLPQRLFLPWVIV